MSDPTTDLQDQTGTEAAQGAPQHVPVNVYETDQAIVVVAPMPGVMADDVTVSIDGGTATLAAAMRTAAQKDYLLHEWHYGPYERTVELPAGFGGAADASFANGQLALRVLRGEGGGQGPVTVNPKP